jgi:hypothetical protein
MSNLAEREHVAGIRPTAQFLTPTQAGIVIGFSYTRTRTIPTTTCA